MSIPRVFSKLASYSDLFGKMLDSVFLLNSETFDILETNESAQRLLQKTLDDLRGVPLASFVDDEARVAFAKCLRVIRRRYYPRELESVWRIGEEQKISVSLNVCSLRLSDGADLIQVIAKDITAVRLAEIKAANYLAELAALNAKLERLSTIDELTGLNNVRAFRGELEKEHARAKRYAGHYAIVFCDVDHFKNYNDRNGHPAGDKVLVECAEILRGACRNTDIAARYGGEEFVFLCPETSATQALQLAERIRRNVAGFAFEHGEHQPLGKVTVSIGVAGYPHDAAEPKQVFEAADQALYASKISGRNRITIFSQLKKSAA